MAQLNLDTSKIEESYGVIQDTVNKGVIDVVNELAAALLPEAGTNTLVDELIGLCKKTQEQYNTEFFPSVKELLKDFEETFNIAEYLAKKASVGEIAKQDVGYKTSGIDAASVVM